MKLYTEEQVKQIVEKSRETGLTAEYLMLTTSAIELPSDEEIDRVARDKIDLSSDCFGQYDFTSGKQDGFYEGAIWMRDKILNK